MGSHFYDGKTGQLIDGGLRAARLVNGLPSPTTVLALIKTEGLIRYFRQQMYQAAVTTPRPIGWTDDQHYDACEQWANQHADTARKRGGDFHNLVQDFHQTVLGRGDFKVPPALSVQFGAYLNWYETYVEKTIYVEQFVNGGTYAGRMDHFARLADGRNAVIDVKTQETSKRAGRFNHYSEWGLQLGAYAGAALESLDTRTDVLVSVCISSQVPVVLEAYYWPKPPRYYHKLFLGLLGIWNEVNNYWPMPIKDDEHQHPQHLQDNDAPMPLLPRPER